MEKWGNRNTQTSNHIIQGILSGGKPVFNGHNKMITYQLPL